jgi:integrase/recombinase XerD
LIEREEAVHGRADVVGAVSAFEVGYVRWLVELGFRPGAVADRLGQFRALSRWLGARGLSLAELDPERVEEFLAARRGAGYRSFVAASSLRLPLDYLMGIGVVPLLDKLTARSPVDRLLEEYRRYLSLERRLAETTIAGYERVARVFLADASSVPRFTRVGVSATNGYRTSAASP